MTGLSSYSSERKPSQARSPLLALANLSLRAKLILAFLTVTLVSVAAVAFFNNLSATSILTEQVSENLDSLAHTQALNVGSLLAGRVGVMQALVESDVLEESVAAQNNTYQGKTATIETEMAKLDEQWKAANDDDPLIQTHLNNALAVELKEFARTFPDLVETFATDRYGGLVASSNRTSDYYQADEGWWQAAFNDGQGAIYIGEPAFDESSQTLSINMAVPIHAQGTRTVIGVLRTTLDITSLANSLKVTKWEKAAVDLYFSGEQVYAADELAFESIDPVTLAQLKAITEGHARMLYQGIPSLISLAPVVSLSGETFVSDLGWLVIIKQEEGKALAVVGQQTRNTAGLAVVITLLTGLVAVVLGRQLAGPIANLTGVTARISAGDLTARAPVTARDEVGLLAASFNKMADQLQETLAGLERRVAERTRELEASQRVTFAASERVSPDQLLGLVVNLIRDQFNLYHVQVYIVDEAKQAAVLRESTGYAGRQLLQRSHHIPLDQPALVTKAIHEGQPVLVDDVGADPDFLPNPLLPDTRSELVVPLKVGARVLGALDAQDRQVGRFSQNTVALFQSMAGQVSFLFENSELLERISGQAEALTLFTNQLRTAAEIARRLGTILDPEQLLQQVVEMMQTRFGLYHAHIYVLDTPPASPPHAGGTEGGRLTVQAGSGEVGRVLRQRGHSIPLDAEKSVVARAARSKEVVLVEDTTLESDFMPNPLLPQTRSEIAVPLVVGDKMLGVLDVQDDQPYRFTQADVDTYTTLAGQVATSLQNAGLFEEQKRAEEAVRESETKFRTLAETTPAAIFIYQGPQIRYVNAGAAAMTGYTETELLNMNFWQVMHPDFRELTREQGMARQRGEQVPSRYEIKILTKDGEARWIDFSAGAIEFEGESAGLGTAFDITERKQAEEAVRASEARFRDVALSTSDWVWEVDSQGRYTYCSEKVVNVLGYTAEEMLGKTPFDVMPPDEAARVGEIFGGIAADKQPIVDLGNRNVTKDGREVYLLTNGVPILDQEGNLVGYRGVDKDITEQKRVEAERAQSAAETRIRFNVSQGLAGARTEEEVLDAMIRVADFYPQARVAIVMIDPDTEEPTLVVRRDAAFESEMTSIVAEGMRFPLAQFPLTQHITPDAPFVSPNLLLDERTDPASREVVSALGLVSVATLPITAGKEWLGEVMASSREEGYFDERKLYLYQSLAEQGAVALRTARLYDETQQAAERLREVDRLKSEFLANMSHELRTPLNSILGYTEVLLMGIDGEVDPETLTDVQAIYDNGQHLLHLISDILDLAKIEAGRLSLNMEEVEIKPLIDEVNTSTTGLLLKQQKPVELRIEVAQGLPHVRADRLRLNQILNNLVGNAVKFTEEGHITLRAFNEDGWVCLEVEDTGIGIKEADLETIFEQFRQADGSFKRRAEGTGLGLAITRYLVQMHGGTIDVRSQVGQGSTFTVRLPAEHQVAEATAGPGNGKAQKETRRRGK